MKPTTKELIDPIGKLGVLFPFAGSDEGHYWLIGQGGCVVKVIDTRSCFWRGLRYLVELPIGFGRCNQWVDAGQVRFPDNPDLQRVWDAYAPLRALFE